MMTEVQFENGKDMYEREREEDPIIPEQPEPAPAPAKTPFEKWLDESEERRDKVLERFGHSKTTDIILEKAIRPFHYYKRDNVPDPITDSQKDFLTELVNDDRARFVQFCEKNEGAETVGELEDRVADLDKHTASQAIEYMTGG